MFPRPAIAISPPITGVPGNPHSLLSLSVERRLAKEEHLNFCYQNIGLVIPTFNHHLFV
jgi:hypothetical protein